MFQGTNKESSGVSGLHDLDFHSAESAQREPNGVYCPRVTESFLEGKFIRRRLSRL